MEQLVLEASKDLKLHKEDYIISSANNIAYKVVMDFNKVNNFPNHSLLILGDEHSGKTFLLNLWSQKYNAKILNLTPNFQINSLKKEFLALDDIDLITVNEEQLMHLLNWCNQEKIPLLMTAKNYQNFKLPDLSSRIKAVQSVNLKKPDDVMVRIFIAKKFSELSIKIPNKILAFLANNLKRDLVLIEKFVTHLNQEALQSNRKISIDMIKSLLGSTSYLKTTPT